MTAKMKRREFISLLGGAAAAWPLAARAQQLWRIGMLETISPALNAANLAAFRNGLRQLGYVEGQSYVIEYRSVEGRAARFPKAGENRDPIQRPIHRPCLNGTTLASGAASPISRAVSSAILSAAWSRTASAECW